MDQFVAVFSRLNPSEPTEAARLELIKQAKVMIGRHPWTARVFEKGRPIIEGGRTRYLVDMIDEDRRVDRVLTHFAARVGLALYRRVRGQPASAESFISANWSTNVGLDRLKGLDELLGTLGPNRTLSQGEWHVGDQFRYYHASPVDEPELFICFAAFRESFGFLTMVGPAPSFREGWYTCSPGFLKQFQI